MMSAFGFYEDYIEEKSKQLNKKFSYKDFVNQNIIEQKKWDRKSYYTKDFIE